MVTLLNPKGILFHLTIAPLFINPHQDLLQQFTTLIVIFISIVMLNVASYTFLAQYARDWLQKFQYRMQRIGGAILMIFGMMMLLVKRN